MYQIFLWKKHVLTMELSNEHFTTTHCLSSSSRRAQIQTEKAPKPTNSVNSTIKELCAANT